MSGFDPSVLVDTLGWDLIVGLPLTTANEVLGSVGSSTDIEFSAVLPGRTQHTTFKGRFGPWSIVGGSGADIILSIPIDQGEFTVGEGSTGGLDLPAGTFDLSGTNARLSCRLAFTKSPGNQPATSVSFAFDAQAQVMPHNDENTFAPVCLTGGATALPDTVRMVAPYALTWCIAANADKLNLLFATIFPGLDGGNSVSPDDGFWRYTLAGQQDVAAKRLAIFYNSSKPEVEALVLPEQIPLDGDDCYMVVGHAATVREIVVPTLIGALNHAWCSASPLIGIGPLVIDAPPTSNTLPLTILDVTNLVPQTGSASLRGPDTLRLVLGGYSQTTATIRDLAFEVSGANLTMTGSYETDDDAGNSYDFVQVYRLMIGAIGMFGDSVVGMSCWPEGAASINAHLSVDRSAAMGGPSAFEKDMIRWFQERAVSAITSGLIDQPLPFQIHLGLNGRVQPEEGYLNGGIIARGRLDRLTTQRSE